MAEDPKIIDVAMELGPKVCRSEKRIAEAVAGAAMAAMTMAAHRVEPGNYQLQFIQIATRRELDAAVAKQIEEAKGAPDA